MSRTENHFSSGGRNANIEPTCCFPLCRHLEPSPLGYSGGWCTLESNRVPPHEGWPGWPDGFTPSVSSCGGCDQHQSRPEEEANGSAELAAIREENAALREALRPFASMASALRGSSATLLGNGKVLEIQDKYLPPRNVRGTMMPGTRFVRVSHFTAAEAALSGEPSGKVLVIRGPVLWFAEQMERRLAAHDAERGEHGWDDAHGGDWEWLLGRLLEEVRELRATYDRADPEYDSIPAIINEAADVANFAMMLADRAKSHTTVEEEPHED